MAKVRSRGAETRGAGRAWRCATHEPADEGSCERSPIRQITASIASMVLTRSKAIAEAVEALDRDSLRTIFSFLDPRSLMNALRARKSWHVMASDEGLWKAKLANDFPMLADASTEASYRRRYLELWYSESGPTVRAVEKSKIGVASCMLRCCSKLRIFATGPSAEELYIRYSQQRYCNDLTCKLCKCTARYLQWILVLLAVLRIR
jgi:hypothetical protein